MKSILLAASGLACVTLFTAHQAFAQTGELSALTVTAGRGSALQSLDVSTTTVTQQQVQAAPELTLDQLVNRLPGVFTSQVPAAQLHPTGQEFNIRGFGTTTNVNTLVMVDGEPINDPYFRTIDWSQLPKSAVDRIEIIRGGGGAGLWGNMAMGGVINVVTRTPGPDDNRIEASYGSFNTYTGDISLGAAPIRDLKVGVTAAITKTDGYDQTPAQYRNPYMDATASQNTNVTLSAVYTPTATSEVYARLVDHRIVEDGLVWRIAGNTWTADRATVGGSIALTPATTLNASGWYGWNRMSTTNASNPSYTIFTPTLGVPYVSQTETVRYDNFGGSMFVASAWGPFKDIKAGIDARSIVANDPLNLFAATGPTGSIDARAQHYFEGVFAQAVWQAPGLPLEVNGAAREDLWQTANGRISGAYKGSSFSNALAGQSYSRFDPRLGARYSISRDIDLRGAVYENFAAPGMNQMYRAFISGANYTTSNPALKPQTNLGEELGVDLHHGGLAASATVFHNDLANFIDYATVQSGCAAVNGYCGTAIAGIAGGSLRQYVNAGDAVLQGFELLGSWKASETLSLDVGLTRTDAHLTRSNYATASAGVIPDPVGQQIGQVPPWMATAGAAWRPVDRLTLSFKLKSFPAYWNSTSHTQLNQAATIADLGATWRAYKSIELYVLVQNIGAARYYDQGLGYTTTNGSTVAATTVPVLGLPLDASVGVRAAF
ncbi:MAG TPA: TonB-dependent receptor [Caulobacteraceae bacterium]|nr:TonB-dependent receptor [Caulobacteraceae bacterium]